MHRELRLASVSLDPIESIFAEQSAWAAGQSISLSARLFDYDGYL